MAPLADRFAAKVAASSDVSVCWPWTAYTDLQGYGRIQALGVAERAHRVAWMLANGPIPKGLYVCHRCDNKVCCNPAHLFLGTHEDNMADRSLKGGYEQGLVTECPDGHPFSGANLCVTSEGFRACRMCMAVKDRAYKARNRQKLRDKQRARRVRLADQRRAA